MTKSMGMIGRLYGVVACAGLGGLLSACTQTASAPPPATVTPAVFAAPGGSGCAGDISQFQTVLKSDVETGNTNRSVYTRAEPDIGRASAACQSGRDGEARSILAGVKSRAGYR